MQSHFVWEGLNKLSFEHCQLSSSHTGHNVKGVVVGTDRNRIFRCSYKIKTNEWWETVYFSIDSKVDEESFAMSAGSDGKGNWTSSGKRNVLFDGCIDIDISVTPFTNSLPINRLGFTAGRQQEISVVYLDILEQYARPMRQHYLKMDDNTFLFESKADNFQSLLYVDTGGFITEYPSLFKRRTIKK